MLKEKNLIYDISKKAGVVISTVSRVLNNSRLVKKQTKELGTKSNYRIRLSS